MSNDNIQPLSAQQIGVDAEIISSLQKNKEFVVNWESKVASELNRDPHNWK